LAHTIIHVHESAKERGVWPGGHNARLLTLVHHQTFFPFGGFIKFRTGVRLLHLAQLPFAHAVVSSRKNVAGNRKLVSNVIGGRLLHRVHVVGVVRTSHVLAKREALALLEHILGGLPPEAEAAEPGLLAWLLVGHLDREWGLVSLIVHLAVGVGSQSIRYLTDERNIDASLVELHGLWAADLVLLVTKLHLVALSQVSTTLEVLIEEQTLEHRREFGVLYNIYLLVELWLLLLLLLLLLQQLLDVLVPKEASADALKLG
jgi:hypothetical protein